MGEIQRDTVNVTEDVTEVGTVNGTEDDTVNGTVKIDCAIEVLKEISTDNKVLVIEIDIRVLG